MPGNEPVNRSANTGITVWSASQDDPLARDPVFDAAIQTFGRAHVDEVVQQYAQGVTLHVTPEGVGNQGAVMASAIFNARQTLAAELGMTPLADVVKSQPFPPNDLLEATPAPVSNPIPDMAVRFHNALAPEWQNKFIKAWAQRVEMPAGWRPGFCLISLPMESAQVGAMQQIIAERTALGLPPTDIPLPGIETMLMGSGVMLSSNPPQGLLPQSVQDSLRDTFSTSQPLGMSAVSPELVRGAMSMDADTYAVELSMRFAGDRFVLHDVNRIAAKLSEMSPEFKALDGAEKVKIARDVAWQVHAHVGNGAVPPRVRLSFNEVPGIPSWLNQAFRSNGYDPAKFTGLHQDVMLEYDGAMFSTAMRLGERQAAVVQRLQEMKVAWIEKIPDAARRESAYRALADDIIVTNDNLTSAEFMRANANPTGDSIGDVPRTFISYRVAALKNGDLSVSGTLGFGEREANRIKAEQAVRGRFAGAAKQGGGHYTAEEVESLAKRFGSVAAANPEEVASFIEGGRLTDTGARYVEGLPASPEAFIVSSEALDLSGRMMRWRGFREGIAKPVEVGGRGVREGSGPRVRVGR